MNSTHEDGEQDKYIHISSRLTLLGGLLHGMYLHYKLDIIDQGKFVSSRLHQIADDTTQQAVQRT